MAIITGKDSLESLLHRLNMDDELEAFKKQSIKLETLEEMSESELTEALKEMDLNIGRRKKLSKEIIKMKSQNDSSYCGTKHVIEQNESCYCGTKHVIEPDDRTNTEEIRIVILGKTGSGKSATGNTILGEKLFESCSSGSSVTTKCSLESRIRFGKKILVVDTPGCFDTNQTNDQIKKEIAKCVGITSPGPHAFILVVSVTRYTYEEIVSLEKYFQWFGEDSYKYFIVLFASRDKLDKHNKSIDDHIKSCPPFLQMYIERCGNRVVAFNNDLKGDQQVKHLLSLILHTVKENGNSYYTNKMFIEAERIIQRSERDPEQLKPKRKLKNHADEDTEHNEIVVCREPGERNRDELRKLINKYNFEQAVHSVAVKGVAIILEMLFRYINANI